MSQLPRGLRRFVALAAAGLAVMATLVSWPACGQPAAAAAPAFTIAGGSLSLAAPEGFEQVRPKSMMVETEFAIPSEGDAPAGRMTVMGAGGSVEANIDRWAGQFSQPDGGDTKEKVATKKLEIAGCKVTIVDITGTFLDQPGGPFAGGPTVQRPDYRMLAAIVITPEAGNYFIKFYGPAATVGKHAAGFQTMLEGMVPAGKPAR
ncbi:MAG: hypothetical protein RLZZ440_977 [Planctomycetota bacterium]|jgi:hypothetical protein